MQHVKSGQGYNCVHCKKTINEWKNFQRHMKETHGNHTTFSCSYCPYGTKRRHDLGGHIKRIHRNSLIIADALLTELLSVVFNEADTLSNVVVENGRQNDQIITIDDERMDTDNTSESDYLSSEGCGILDPVLDDKDTTPGSDVSASVSNPISEPPFISEYEKIRLANMAEIRAMLLLVFPEKETVNVTPVVKKSKIPSSKEPTRRSSRIGSSRSETDSGNNYHLNDSSDPINDFDNNQTEDVTDANDRVVEEVASVSENSTLSDDSSSFSLNTCVINSTSTALSDSPALNVVYSEMTIDNMEVDVADSPSEVSLPAVVSISEEDTASNAEVNGKFGCTKCGSSYRYED